MGNVNQCAMPCTDPSRQDHGANRKKGEKVTKGGFKKRPDKKSKGTINIDNFIAEQANQEVVFKGTEKL